MVPSNLVGNVLSGAGLLGEPHAEALPLRRRCDAKGLDRLPVLLLVQDREQDGEMDNAALVLRESCCERLRHVAVGLVVTVDNTDDMLDWVLLLLETLQALQEVGQYKAAA